MQELAEWTSVGRLLLFYLVWGDTSSFLWPRSVDFMPLSTFYLVWVAYMVDAMAMNSVRVSSKPAKKVTRKSRIFVLVLAAFGLITVLASPFGYDYYSGKLGLIGAQPEITQTQSGRVIKVPPGGNLQGALERAQSGDIIELQAGAVYPGQINLPNKPHSDFVTIRSSAAADLPEGKRVKPSQRRSEERRVGKECAR